MTRDGPVGALDAESAGQGHREDRQEDQLEEYRQEVSRSGPCQALDVQAGADHEQAGAKGGASDDVEIGAERLRERRQDQVDDEPDRAGPDERVRHEGSRELQTGLPRPARVADEGIEREDVQKGNHGGNCDGHERHAALAEEAPSDRDGDEGVPPGRALEQGGETRTVEGKEALQGRAGQEERPGHQENGADQRAADAENRDGGEVGSRQRVDHERREEHHVGDPLHADPVLVLDKAGHPTEPAGRDDEKDRDQTGENGGHGTLKTLDWLTDATAVLAQRR